MHKVKQSLCVFERYLSMRIFGKDVMFDSIGLELSFIGFNCDNFISLLYSSIVLNFGPSIANSLGCVPEKFLIVLFDFK